MSEKCVSIGHPDRAEPYRERAQVAGGPIRYEWGCDLPSGFKNGTDEGQSVTWVAPDQAGTYQVWVSAIDTGTTTGDVCGSKTDGMIQSAPISIGCHPIVIESASAEPSAGGGGGGSTGSAVIMTGGIQNDVHWAYLTAKVAPATAGGTVKFTIQGTTGVNTPARLSLNGGSGDNSVLAPVNGIGEAKAILTSSDKDMEEITVKVEYPNGGQAPSPKYITVQQATGKYPEDGGFVCDPDMLPSDGISTSTIRFKLIQVGPETPVPGHHIRFFIDSICDTNGDPIRDANGNLIEGPDWPAEYGSITQPNAVTGIDGIALGTYKVGTVPAIINIIAEDNDDQTP